MDFLNAAGNLNWQCREPFKTRLQTLRIPYNMWMVYKWHDIFLGFQSAARPTLLNPAYLWDRGILRQLGEYFTEDPRQIKLFYLISLNGIFKAKPGRTAMFYTRAGQDKRSFSSDTFPFSFDSTCIILSQILSTHLSISNKPKCWDYLRGDKIISMSVWFCSNFAQRVVV